MIDLRHFVDKWRYWLEGTDCPYVHGMTRDELRQLLEAAESTLSDVVEESFAERVIAASSSVESLGVPPVLDAVDLAARAIAQQREQITGVAELGLDLAGIITMILELFQNCGNGGAPGVPPEPLTDSQFIESIRNPDATGERVYQQTAWREAQTRVPKQRGLRGRALRLAQEQEYSLVYWTGKRAVSDASDGQILAMRDAVTERQKA